MAGIEHTDAKAIVVMDADGEELDIIGHRTSFFDIHSTKAKQFGFSMDIGGGEKLTCCGDEPFSEPVVGPVDEVRRLAQLLRSSQRIPHPGLMVPVVVERMRGLALVNIRDLIEHLPKRPHPRSGP